MISNFGIRVSGCIVNKLIDSKYDILTRSGLKGGGDGPDICLYGVVNGSNIIVVKTTEFLTVFELSRS